MPTYSRLPTGAPEKEPLVDGFGRIADDLRISVTDRCNFRCTYCMPAEGLTWLPREEVLTFEEVTRVLSVFLSLGIRAVKLSGGEPTLRADFVRLVGMLREEAGLEIEISMTTNGYLLDRLAEPLIEAGLSRVTVSVDSLMRHRFAHMTRRDALDKVLKGIAAAERAGFPSVKINCVVIRGQNDGEIVDFAAWARETDREVRFIEYMPLDSERSWERADVVPTSEIIGAISPVFPVEPVPGETEPASLCRFADGAAGRVGFVSSVTRPFCDSCHRLRLTAEGHVRSCLFALEETDLREPLRAGARDEEMADLIRGAVRGKWAGHRINRPDFERPARSMSMIGG